MVGISRMIWILARLGDRGGIDVVLALGVAGVDVLGGYAAGLLGARRGCC